MIRTRAWGLFLLVLLACARLACGAVESPNIVFFLSDDQRFDCLGCAGHPVMSTPTMDHLAANGTRFTNMFVTTSICAASRATILTGLYERSHRFTFGTPPIRAEACDNSYPSLLRQAGYHTGFVGKFGVAVAKGKREAMFDVFVPLNRSPYFKKQADGSQRHITQLAADRAIDFLESAPDDKPFCLSVSFNAPHAEDNDKNDHFPWPKAVNHLYRDVDVAQPRLLDTYDDHPEFLKQSLNRVRWHWRWDTDEKYEKNLRAYYRMISGVDHAMGRVLDALAALGQSENTVIVFASDNGYYKGDRGFAGKWSHFEESLRVPLIISDPRSNRDGAVSDQMVLNVDIPKTILSIAMADSPASYQGRDLMPLVRGDQVSNWRTEFFCEHLMEHDQIPKWEGIRGQRYVYARYFEQDPVYEYLHDLESDPNQRTNLATSDQYAKLLTKLRTRCDRLRQEYGGEFKPWPPKKERSK